MGDGSFGDARDEALFPISDDRLGEERTAEPPRNLHFAPDPSKITAPVMAVRWRSYLVSMEWDPTLGWSGVLRAPNALFASPNFLEGGANHRFALWVPTIPRWADENTQQAREPFRLLKGETVVLRATLSVRTDAEEGIQAMEPYRKRLEMPSPPCAMTQRLRHASIAPGLRNHDNTSQPAWRRTNTGTARDTDLLLSWWDKSSSLSL